MSDLEQLLAAVDGVRDDIIAFHRDLVRIPTVNTGQMPTGNETAACEYIARALAAEGIESEILESAPTRGNLIARLGGSGSGPSLLFMGHLDVVPVGDEKAWIHPPFSAELVDGKIWGRGSADCKATTVPQHFATVLLKRSGLPLKGDLVFTGTADEEAGGFYGYRWLATNHPEKIRTTYAVNEGGGTTMASRQGLLYGLSLGEKGRTEVTITVSGKPGHAARPWLSDNALEKAGRVLTAIAAWRPEIDLSHPIFDHLGDMVEGMERPTLETLEGVLARLDVESPATATQLRGLSRMTLTPTILHSGVKSNIVPDSAVLNCDARTLPGQGEAHVRAVVEGLVAGIPGVRVETRGWATSTQSPFETPFVAMLERATRVALGREDVRLIPNAAVGFTDSQYVRPLGVHTYGYNPVHPDGPAVNPGIHGLNEYIDVETLIMRTKLYLATAYFTLVEGI